MKINFNSDWREQRPRNRWGLSQIGDCERKLVLIDMGFESKPFDANTLRIFRAGDFYEEIMKEEIEGRGFPIHNAQGEVFWIDRWGHIDGEIHVERTKGLWENKSCNSWAFKGLSKEGVQAKYPQYYDQVMAYMNAGGYPWTFWTAIDKNNSRPYQEIIPYCEKESLRLRNKILMIRDYLDRKQVPPIPKWVTWHCKYCAYEKTCKEIG